MGVNDPDNTTIGRIPSASSAYNTSIYDFIDEEFAGLRKFEDQLYISSMKVAWVLS
jgi:hypothetical protein